MNDGMEYSTRFYSDVALMQALSEGCKEAFRELVHAYLPMVSRTAYRILCDRKDADAVTVAVFRHLWENSRRYDNVLPLPLWLLKMTCRKSRLRITRRRLLYLFGFRPELIVFTSPKPPLEDDYILKKVWEVYCRAAIDLTAGQRIVYALCELEELSVEVAAEIAGMSEYRVRYALEQGRQKVTDELRLYEKDRKIQ